MGRYIEIDCPSCGMKFYRSVKQVNAVVKRSMKWTCKSCVTVMKNKSMARNIGSTRVHVSGYIEIKTIDGWRRQHVVVMENHLGRKIIPGVEAVHHIDHNKKNNDISNLELMSHGDHTRHHNNGRKVSYVTKNKIAMSNRKYTMDQARRIRDLVKCGFSQADAAKAVGISRMVVSRIVRNLIYKEESCLV